MISHSHWECHTFHLCRWLQGLNINGNSHLYPSMSEQVDGETSTQFNGKMDNVEEEDLSVLQIEQPLCILAPILMADKALMENQLPEVEIQHPAIWRVAPTPGLPIRGDFLGVEAVRAEWQYQEEQRVLLFNGVADTRTKLFNSYFSLVFILVLCHFLTYIQLLCTL